MTCFTQGNDIHVTKGDKFNFIITGTGNISQSDKCELYISQSQADVTANPIKFLETNIIVEDRQFRFNIATSDLEFGTYYYAFTINNEAPKTKEAFVRFIVLDGTAYESELDKGFIESINASIDAMVAKMGLNDTDPRTVSNFEEISKVQSQLLARLDAISARLDEITNKKA